MAQIWHFWSIWARPCRLIQCPVDGSVGGCGARAVSRKTPIYFIVVDGVVVVVVDVVDADIDVDVVVVDDATRIPDLTMILKQSPD